MLGRQVYDSGLGESVFDDFTSKIDPCFASVEYCAVGGGDCHIGSDEFGVRICEKLDIPVALILIGEFSYYGL